MEIRVKIEMNTGGYHGYIVTALSYPVGGIGFGKTRGNAIEDFKATTRKLFGIKEDIEIIE